jgi:hypothetical protein
MKRVARDETVAIREEPPPAYCCNKVNGVGEGMGKIEDVTRTPVFAPCRITGKV